MGLDEIIHLPSQDKSFNGPVSLHPKDSQGRDIGAEYLKSMATAATHSSDQTWELGRGLYTATEPLASISYSGKSQGFLLKVNVPAESNYLDLRLDHRKIPIKSNTAKILGCFLAQQDPDYFKKYEYPMKALVQNINGTKSEFDFTEYMKHTASRELVSKIFSRRKLVFTAGGYGDYNYKECHLDDRQHFMTMAVFQNPDALKNVTTEVFVPSLEKNLNKDKKMAYGKLRDFFSTFDCEAAELRDNRKVRLCDGHSPSENTEFKRYTEALNNVLPPITPTRSKYRQELTRNLFGCDPKIKSEYDPPTQIKADEH